MALVALALVQGASQSPRELLNLRGRLVDDTRNRHRARRVAGRARRQNSLASHLSLTAGDRNCAGRSPPCSRASPHQAGTSASSRRAMGPDPRRESGSKKSPHHRLHRRRGAAVRRLSTRRERGRGTERGPDRPPRGRAGCGRIGYAGAHASRHRIDESAGQRAGGSIRARARRCGHREAATLNRQCSGRSRPPNAIGNGAEERPIVWIDVASLPAFGRR